MKLMTWNKKEMMYGFITIFLMLIVYMLGQQTTMQMDTYVHDHCPTAIIQFASPFIGISILNDSSQIDVGNVNLINATGTFNGTSFSNP